MVAAVAVMGVVAMPAGSPLLLPAVRPHRMCMAARESGKTTPPAAIDATAACRQRHRQRRRARR